MPRESVLDDLVAPGRTLVPVGDGVLSALGPSTGDQSYDRWSGVYDRLIPNRIYNRLAWGTDPGEYVAFAREAVDAGAGPMLDVAGGSAVFTAATYRAATRTIVLTDLSLGMLARARRRVRDTPRVAVVQADATDPPFAREAFETVACMSAMHVFPDPAAVVRALLPLVTRGGRLFLSGLVAETRVGSAYLRALERAGEVGPPLTEAQLETASSGAPKAVRSGHGDGVR